jgi:hypothetical protein
MALTSAGISHNKGCAPAIAHACFGHIIARQMAGTHCQHVGHVWTVRTGQRGRGWLAAATHDAPRTVLSFAYFSERVLLLNGRVPSTFRLMYSSMVSPRNKTFVCNLPRESDHPRSRQAGTSSWHGWATTAGDQQVLLYVQQHRRGHNCKHEGRDDRDASAKTAIRRDDAHNAGKSRCTTPP